METIASNSLSKAELSLLIAIVVYFLINGAQIFETLVLVPKWTANAPESFSLLSDKNGMSLKSFWITFHSLHEITFIIAIVCCWQISPVKNLLLILFTMHFAVRVWTILYFAPNIIDFQNIYEQGKSAANLAARVDLWKTLNYVRVGLYLIISVAMIPVLLKLLNISRPG